MKNENIIVLSLAKIIYNILIRGQVYSIDEAEKNYRRYFEMLCR